MSMTTELVEKLRHYAEEYKNPPYGREIVGTKELLTQAADTIENSYNGGWIPIDKMLPEIGKPVLVSDIQGNVCVRAITSKVKGKKYWSQGKHDVTAWQPLLPAYKPKDN